MQRGLTIWLTGLSGAGKTTISDALSRELANRGVKLEVLDGDVIRTNLSKGLGFSKEDRDTNIRRVGFVAHLLTRNGVICIASVISPYHTIRQEIRNKIGDFLEVWVNCPIEICEERDVKGLYAKARAGKIKGFTGIDDPYEEPAAPEVICETHKESLAESVAKVLLAMEERGYLPKAKAVGD